MPIEPQNAPFFEGDISNVIVLDPGQQPTSIIHIGDAWKIRVKWNVKGLFAGTMTDNTTWHVSIVLESFGKGFEGEVAHDDVLGNSVPLVALERTYEATLPAFPGGVPGNLIPGPYKMAAVLTLTDTMTGNPVPIAGYFEGQVMQFYKA
ncbi:MAG TPA: hypothetical protein PKD09_25305 [Aggregatilinea sp.]|jgi:hypothetical protein|uniref:hypothetical protein n=1 Tax=Aggregatilinea sp. TaxID=2806333 RepID=UPI002BDA2352|nr:hypothetical protein [Aggregatilinea sp.]HML24997.1 hypothetical protein [Aggregatilinea sp.]